ANGNVTVGDTDLFSPHSSLCGSFSDVPYGSYNYEFIYYLACHGIVSGYNDTTFRPSNLISRGQLSKMVSRDEVAGAILLVRRSSRTYSPAAPSTTSSSEPPLAAISTATHAAAPVSLAAMAICPTSGPTPTHREARSRRS
ncbi:MAG: S-layer homology domain-containing protein, partial [Chloroflexia bacterium]